MRIYGTLRLVPAVPIPRRNPLSLLVQGLAHKQKPIKTKAVGVIQLAKHLQFLLLRCGCWGESLHPPHPKRVAGTETAQLNCPSTCRCLPWGCCAALGAGAGKLPLSASSCGFFQFLSYWRRNFLTSGGRAKGEITATEYREHQQTTCLESGQRLERGRQRHGDIPICTQISTSCLHPPAHAMITKLRRCVERLQRESLMAALRAARSAPGTGALS